MTLGFLHTHSDPYYILECIQSSKQIWTSCMCMCHNICRCIDTCQFYKQPSDEDPDTCQMSGYLTSDRCQHQSRHPSRCPEMSGHICICPPSRHQSEHLNNHQDICWTSRQPLRDIHTKCTTWPHGWVQSALKTRFRWDWGGTPVKGSESKLSEDRNLMYSKWTKAHLILICSMNTDHESMAYWPFWL